MVRKLEQESQVINNNDEKVKKYNKRRIAKWLIVILSVIVIILEILALFNKINMLWGCGVFVIVTLLKVYFKKIF